MQFLFFLKKKKEERRKIMKKKKAHETRMFLHLPSCAIAVPVKIESNTTKQSYSLYSSIC